MKVELRTILEFRLLGTRIATILLAYRFTPPPGFPRSHPGGIGHFRKWRITFFGRVYGEKSE